MSDSKLSALAAASAREGAYFYGIVGGSQYKFAAESLVADHLSVALADFVGTNGNSAQPVFDTPQDAITLLVDSTYLFEAFYHIVRSAGTTSHTSAVLFGGTATFDAIRYLARIANPTGNVLASGQQIVGEDQNALVLTSANTSATENLMIHLQGIIRTNAGGTLIPQFKFSSAPGGAPTVKANSFFRATRLGSDQFVKFGSVG